MPKNPTGVGKAFEKLERKEKEKEKERKYEAEQQVLRKERLQKETAEKKKKVNKRLIIAAAALVICAVVGGLLYANADSVERFYNQALGSFSGSNSKEKKQVNCSLLQNQYHPKCRKRGKKQSGSSFMSNF